MSLIWIKVEGFILRETNQVIWIKRTISIRFNFWLVITLSSSFFFYITVEWRERETDNLLNQSFTSYKMLRHLLIPVKCYDDIVWDPVEALFTAIHLNQRRILRGNRCHLKWERPPCHVMVRNYFLLLSYFFSLCLSFY